jgi:hypothetical protein
MSIIHVINYVAMAVYTITGLRLSGQVMDSRVGASLTNVLIMAECTISVYIDATNTCTAIHVVAGKTGISPSRKRGKRSAASVQTNFRSFRAFHASIRLTLNVRNRTGSDNNR